MKGKTDYSKADKQRRMLIYGHEPISKDYAEFPPKYNPMVTTSPRTPLTRQWIDGQPNPLNHSVQLRYLRLIEEACTAVVSSPVESHATLSRKFLSKSKFCEWILQ